MEQIGFFEDIGCKEPPEPKPKKKKSKPLPGSLPDSAKQYFAEQVAKECSKEALSVGDKINMENRIYAWMKTQGRELTAHQIAEGMFYEGIHYSKERQSVAPRLKGLEDRELIEKTGRRVFDRETGASAGTYRVVEGNVDE